MLWLIPFTLAAPTDRVVAVIDEHVVLQSDQHLDEALAEVDPVRVPFWMTGSPVERQVHAAIIDVAAGDVALYRPSDAEVAKRMEALRAAFPSRDEWTAFLFQFGLRELDLAAVLRKRMRVEAYLLRNIAPPPSNVPVFQMATVELLASLEPRVRVRRIATQ